MEKKFSNLHSGEEACLYTIQNGGLTAKITNLGATLVQLWVPDASGTVQDVVLGYDDAQAYVDNDGFLGATVGRNANRIAGSRFPLDGKICVLTPNEGENNLHSGPHPYNVRLWTLANLAQDSVTLTLESPDGDQGFPGTAHIRVTYRLDGEGGLHICYEGRSDRETVFNMTNHSYFNLAGQEYPEKAVHQVLSMPARHFCPDDAQNIPTGEECPVADTPMDFRVPKPISRDLDADYEPLHLQGGYDHNFEVFCNPCATLTDPESGRSMSVYTDCPGVQLYSGNYLDQTGKGGVHYGKHSGIALETQFYPDALNKPQWKKPIVPAGKRYVSETVYRFSWR